MMKEGGISLSEIALELDMPDGPSVVQLLREQYKQDASYLTKEDKLLILALEMGRLDRLLRACWESALLNDPKSIDNAIKIVMAQAKLAKLDTPDAEDNRHEVLVIGGLENEYVDALRKKAGDN